MGERPRARSETLALTYINVAGEQRDTELFGLGPIWATQVASNPKNEKTNEHTGAGRTMYRFLEGTADQYMTRAVTTVTRQTTIRELEALIEKTRFQFFPRSGRRKDVGDRYKIRFSPGLCLHDRSDGARIRHGGQSPK
jgi:hypothetical protein